MTIESNNHSRSGEEVDKGRYQLPKLISTLQERTVLVLSRLLAEMLDSADDAFYDMAEKALEQSEQTLYFDSMRELRIRRKGIESLFKKSIQKAFTQIVPSERNFNATLSQAEDMFHENMSLVQEDDLEENLAIDAMVNKARSRNQVTLKQLNVRINSVIGREIELEDIPFDPKWACRAFAEGCLSLDLELKSRLLFYKLFDRNVVSQLSLLYNQANQYMVEQGVLPEMRLNSSKKPQSTEERSKYAVKEAFGKQGVDEENGAEVSSVGFESFMAFQQLLTQANISSYEVIPGAPIILGSELISQLSRLQSDKQLARQHQSSTMSAQEIRQLISVNNGTNQVPNLEKTDSDVIDVVAMLFDFILDDNNLPVEIKALIARLQLPVVKLAIMDKAFFSRQVHPARKLLNLLSKAGIGFSNNDKASELLGAKVEEIVNRVLNDFNDNTQVFAELVVDFSKFLASDAKRRSILERRVCEAEQGKAKSLTAKSRVQEVLAEIYDGNFIPTAVERLMEEAWEQVLFLTHTRSGEESDEWKRRLSAVKNLVVSVQKSRSPQAKAHLAKILPGMLIELKSGFESIGLDKLTAAKLLKALAECHRATLTGKDVEGVWYGDVPEELIDVAVMEPQLDDQPSVDEVGVAPPTLEPAVTSSVGPDKDESAMPTMLVDRVDMKKAAVRVKVRPRKVEINSTPLEVPVGLEKYVKQVEAYESGTWFEIVIKGDRVRCKLAARIPATHKYLFVGRSGMKVAEFNDIELAMMLQCGELKVLDDSALFDRALESVITSLRQAKQSA